MNKGINSKEITKQIIIGDSLKVYVNLNSNNSNLHILLTPNTGYQDIRLPIVLSYDLVTNSISNNLSCWKVEVIDEKTIKVKCWDNAIYTLIKDEDTKVYRDENKTISLEKMYLKDSGNTTFNSYQITDQVGVTYRIDKNNFKINKLTYQEKNIEITNDGNYRNFIFDKTKLTIGIDNKLGITRVFTIENSESLITNIIDYDDNRKLKLFTIDKAQNNNDGETIHSEQYSFDLTNKNILINDIVNEIKHVFTIDETKNEIEYLKTKNNETIHEITFTYENTDKKYHETILNENNKEYVLYFDNDNLILSKTDDEIITKYVYDNENKLIKLDRNDFNNYLSSEYNLLTRKQSWTPSNPINIVTLNTLVPTFAIKRISNTPYILKGTFETIKKGTYTLSGIINYNVLSTYKFGVTSPFTINFKFKNGTKEILSFVSSWDKDDETINKKIYLLEKIELNDDIDNVEITFSSSNLNSLGLEHLCLNEFSNLTEYFYDEDKNIQYTKQYLIKENYQDSNFYKVEEVLNYGDEPYLISSSVVSEVTDNKNYIVTNTNEYGLINEKTYKNAKLVKQATKINNLKLEKSYTYDGNFMTSSLDENSYEIQYDYNKNYNVIESVVDKATKTINKYNDNYELLKSINLTSDSVDKTINYEYDDKKRINKVICDNKEIYKFEYEDDRVKSIFVADEENTRLLVSYDYFKNIDNQYYITSKKYNNEEYKYEYDKQGNLLAISNIKNKEETQLMSLGYDEHNRLDYLEDYLIKDSYYYSYDINGNLIKITSNNLNETNIIDKENNLINTNIKNGDYQVTEESFSVHKLNVGKKAKIQKLKYDTNNTNNDYYCFFDEGDTNLISSVYDSDNDIIRIKRKVAMTLGVHYSDLKSPEYTNALPKVSVINNVPCIEWNATTKNYYTYKFNDGSHILKGTISFWMKKEKFSDFAQCTLLAIGQKDDTMPTLSLNIGNVEGANEEKTGDIYLLVRGNGHATFNRININIDSLNEWNFISISWELKKKETNKYYLNKATLIVNETIKTYNKPDTTDHVIELGFDISKEFYVTLATELQNIDTYKLPSKDENNEGIYSESQIYYDGLCEFVDLGNPTLYFTCIMINCGLNKSTNEITNYKNKTSFVVDESEAYYGKNENNKIISNTFLNLIEPDNFKIYPLHKSLLSLNGDDTLEVLANNEYQKRNNYLFTYSDLLNANRLLLKEELFVYKQVSIKSGTVALRTNISKTSEAQTIFAFMYDLNTEQVEEGIFILNVRNGILSIGFWPNDNGAVIEVGAISEGTHFIALTFTQVVNSDYQDVCDYTIKVAIDNTIKTIHIAQYVAVEKAYLFIGKSPLSYKDQLSDGFDMFSYSSKFSSDATLNNLRTSINNHIQKEDTYNGIGLLTGSTIKHDTLNLHNEYVYAKNNGNTLLEISNQIIIYGSSYKNIEYNYDFKGRITSKQDLYGITEYTYNDDDILQEEKIISSDKTIRYSYDRNNNITTVSDNTGLTTNFYYEDNINKDLLTRYTNNKGLEHHISYDNDGFPIKRYSVNKLISAKNDIYLYEWTNRRLTKYVDKLTSQTFTFIYDAQGRRVKKIVDNTSLHEYSETNYYYDANNRLIMEISEQLGTIKKFYYDSNDTLISIEINGEMLYYIRDVTNTIIGLLNSSNEIVAKYSYDAFGNVLTKEGKYATKNPILFKGYYYEHSMRLYYLVSRYYDPSIRRFISPDSINYLEPTSFNGLNLYAYCGNDPVNYYDPTGHFVVTTTMIIGLAIGVFIGAGVGFGLMVIADYKDDGHIFNGSIGWEKYLQSTLTGAILGGAVGFFAGAGGSVVVKGILSVTNKFVTDLFSYTLTGTKFGTWEDYTIAFISGALIEYLRLVGTAKALIDVAFRPVFTQLIKMGTNTQNSFNYSKLLYDVLTRGITTLAPSPFKAIYRAAFKSIWDNKKEGFGVNKLLENVLQ